MASSKASKTNSRDDDALSGNGRDRLLKTGLRMFAENGFDGTTVRDLAAAAGVSFGLIRKHFGSKDGLRDAVEEYVLTELQGFYARSLPADTGDFAQAAQSAVEFFEHDRDILLYLRFALMHPQKGTQNLIQRYFDMYRNIVDELVKNGRVNPNADLRWGAFMLMFMQLGPLIMEPFAEQLLGQSMYDGKLLDERQRAYINMLTEPFLRS